MCLSRKRKTLVVNGRSLLYNGEKAASINGQKIKRWESVMGLTLQESVSALTVFLQGILSFFSPCVLPLVPLYIGYLSGGAKTVAEDGSIHYGKGKVFLHTVFFIIGISFAFFLLGLGFTSFGQFFRENRRIVSVIGGILVVGFGIYQLGIWKNRWFAREHRLHLKINPSGMNPLMALVFGFTFSFAWTPCVGPALASVLLMASSSESAAMGFVLIGVYTLGFVIPFLAVGLFTSTLLDLFRRHQKVVSYTVKIGGVLMIFMGIMMITGWMNTVSGYLSSLGNGLGNGNAVVQETAAGESEGAAGYETESGTVAETESAGGGEEGTEETGEEETEASADTIPAPDFSYADQYGNAQNLSDYQGKVIFLNFWATWCGYCVEEMGDIQELYEEYGRNEGDVVILGAASPVTLENPNTSEQSEEAVIQFLEENGYTYPVIMDTDGQMFWNYGISSLPSTFMILPDGNVYGWVPGALSKEDMKSIIEQTLEAAGMNR